jgi:farnesyl diphosphate synthase
MAETKQRFLDLFPKLTNELVAVLTKEGMPKEAQDWYRRSLDYNTPGGKLNRGLSVVDTVQILLNKDRLDDAEFEKAAVLGWCVELVSPKQRDTERTDD